ncbi:MAG TPA: hypothetical protein VED40_19190 [Azospirillaceae bacterium]|nr:hypothetical protein [Azospirillaceae bacterium]
MRAPGQQRRSIMRPAWLLIGATALAGCQGSTFLDSVKLGGGSALATSADLRLVTSSPAPSRDAGRNTPANVVCAEPSPDVAKIASSAFDFGGSGGLKLAGPEQITSRDLQMALALSASRAEALAQLTQRLATIQLLRDGLYRACEAYANGAISDTTYAVLLSRFDDTMITLLSSELVAGNFGQDMATLGSSASGAAFGALAPPGGSAAALQEARNTLATKRAAVDTNQTLYDEASAKLKAAEAKPTPDAEEIRTLTEAKTKALGDLNKAKRDAQLAQEALDETATATARSQAEATASAAGGKGAANTQNSHVIGEIQSRYINSLNADALMVACITALDRSPPISEAAAAHIRDYKLAKDKAEKAVGQQKEILEEAARSAEYNAYVEMAKVNISAFAQVCRVSILGKLGDLAQLKVEGQVQSETDDKALGAAITRLVKAREDLSRLDAIRKPPETKPDGKPAGKGS